MIGGTSSDRRALEREALRNVINQWNANRLDLFELSEPNEVSFNFTYQYKDNQTRQEATPNFKFLFTHASNLSVGMETRSNGPRDLRDGPPFKFIV